jgi:hypothetical protein
MIDTIYLDMDGVICDFDKLYHSTYGVNCRDDPNKDNWYDFVKNNGFFNLPTTKNADKLIDKIFSLDVNVIILSCVSDKSNSSKVRNQKIKWLCEHNLGHLPSIFTKTKLEKSNHASPNSILIDDSVACINPFKQKGGYGILHENVKSTVSQLDCLIEKGLLCALSLVQET